MYNYLPNPPTVLSKTNFIQKEKESSSFLEGEEIVVIKQNYVIANLRE